MAVVFQLAATGVAIGAFAGLFVMRETEPGASRARARTPAMAGVMRGAPSAPLSLKCRVRSPLVHP